MELSSSTCAQVVYDGAVTRADLESWSSDLEELFTRVGPVFYRVSRRGESHPPPLSGPDVTISRHPAPTVRPEVVRVMRCQ